MSLKHLAAATLGVCAAILIAVPVSAQEKVRVTASSESFFHVPIYAAQDLGYFAQQGLQVEMLPTSTGQRSIAAAISGDVEMVIGAPFSIIAAHTQGADLMMFAGEGTQYGVNIAVSKKWAESHKLTATSSYKDRLGALKGMTIGISGPGGGSDLLVRYAASEAGVNPDRDMTLVTLGEAAAILAAFSQGRIDGLAQSSPTSNIAVRNFDGYMLINTTKGEIESLQGYLGSAISARADWLKKNTPATIKFIKGLQMSLNGMHDPARTTQLRDAVHKSHYAQTDPAFFAEVWADLAVGAPKTPELTDKMIKTLVDFNNRFAKDKIEMSKVTGAYTNEYVEKAR